MIRHVVQPGCVSINRQPLIGVVEVAVIKGVAHRQAGDVSCRQFLRIGLPLLCGVIPDKRLVEGPADQRNRLLFQVCRILGINFRRLFLDQFLRILRGIVLAKELVNQAQPHGELVGGAVVHGKHAMLVAREIRELIDVIPHAFVGCVEKMRAIFVHLNARLRLGLGICVAAEVGASLHNEHVLSQLACRAFCHC